MSTAPVLNYDSIDSPVMYHRGRVISLGELLLTVDYLARQLPPHKHLLNLYEDRYHFLLGFLLGLKQQSISLFPSTVTPHVLSQLQHDYDDILVLAHTGNKQGDFQHFDLGALLAEAEFYPDILPRQLSQHATDQSLKTIIPDVELTREVAIIFTSGSTGLPQPYSKQWGDFIIIARLLADKFLSERGHNLSAAVIATVPAQHMYGLEASILMAIQNGLLIHSSKPFFPQDITHCLEDITGIGSDPAHKLATTLIITPLHLKACIKTNVPLPGVGQFISATAPLDQELAQQCESRYGARVMEIFGCTEVGSMAWRRTIASEQWNVMDDIRLTAMSNGADGHHADEQNVRLDTSRSIKQFLFNDVIELVDEQHFILKGRKEDLINLAGKRTSLAYLNHHLQSCDVLLDGCFYQDDSYPEGRLIAFVVLKPNQRERVSHTEITSKQTILTIRAHLKNKIEPVFLPKKIYFVNALPRNATGKLPLSELKKLLQQLLQEQGN